MNVIIAALPARPVPLAGAMSPHTWRLLHGSIVPSPRTTRTELHRRRDG
ncbi:MAG: hypothetical protein QOD93_5833 [Acetobacteraceae bacterium]|jgi:hypothetical protein|nr:hypothetical protein [Acetobacteraceae bacterium]